MSTLNETAARVVTLINARGHTVSPNDNRVLIVNDEPVPEIAFVFNGHMPREYLGAVILREPRTSRPINGGWTFIDQKGPAESVSMYGDSDIERAVTAICEHLDAR